MFKINELSQSPLVLQSPEGRLLMQDERVNLVYLRFKLGESIPVHKNPVDVMFFVIRGSGVLQIGNETHEIKEGSGILITANEDRGWSNTDNPDLELLVVKLMK